jgi:hypothetical protein
MAHVWKTINVVVCLTTNHKQKQQNNYLNHSSHPMLQQKFKYVWKAPEKMAVLLCIFEAYLSQIQEFM